MSGEAKMLVQRLVNRFGYQIVRRDSGVSLVNPYSEQRRILGPDVSVVFEVGAFDGRDCLTYADLFRRAKIHAFEPVPESFEKVRSKAQVCDRITPYNCALADYSGSATFHLSNWIDASSLLRPVRTGSSFDAYQESKKSITVPVDTLDEVCSRGGISQIDLLKMDAQGAELKILSGATRMLSESRVRMVFTEVHFLQSYDGAARFDQLMNRLVESGFRFHSFYGLNHNHRGQTTWGDALFVHDKVDF